MSKDGVTSEDDRIAKNLKCGDEIKVRYLETLQKYVHYQKELSALQLQNTSDSTKLFGAVAKAVKEITQNMGIKPKVSGLERLSVPSWDGSRKTYATWKKGANITKTRMNSSSASVKHAKGVLVDRPSQNLQGHRYRAWEILDIELADRWKLMNELLAEINNCGAVRSELRVWLVTPLQYLSF